MPTKTQWLKALRETQDKYSAESFLNPEVRAGYCDDSKCSLCQLARHPNTLTIDCDRCIYNHPKLAGEVVGEYGGMYCFSLRAILPDHTSGYREVKARHDYLRDVLIPLVESISRKDKFFKKVKEQK